MKKLSFYHQKRRDGGIRTGVDLNDEPVFTQFEPGDVYTDAALLWFVDVRCSGRNLPAEPEAIRQWLLEQGDRVRAGLRTLADELATGIDSSYPLKHDLRGPPGVTMAIYCSAMRRLSGREIAMVLRQLEGNWNDLIEGLPCQEAALALHG